jgi:hypothetical protein
VNKIADIVLAQLSGISAWRHELKQIIRRLVDERRKFPVRETVSLVDVIGETGIKIPVQERRDILVHICSRVLRDQAMGTTHSMFCDVETATVYQLIHHYYLSSLYMSHVLS